MKGINYHNRPRSLGAQIDRMRRWPAFNVICRSERLAAWQGPLRGFQQFYTIKVVWAPDEFDRPYVYLVTPALTPRSEGVFDEIPHLIYNQNNPAQSGLCLYDPDDTEWSDCKLIADTTIPWTAKWLFYYELWHYDGVWRGGGVGPESVAATRSRPIPSKEG